MGKIVQYTPDQFALLKRAAERMGPNYSLYHRPFVDYYYTGNAWCKLFLFMQEDAVIGSIGVDSMRFELNGQPLMTTFATSYYALESGAGGPLYMKWMRSNPAAIIFGGSEDTHRIARAQHWTYIEGVKVYELNRPIVVYPQDPPWRALGKRVAQLLPKGTPVARCLERMPKEAYAHITLREETLFTDDLLPASSPFAFRLAPTVDYLNWRYRTDLSFVRYRLFRILKGGATAGYVVINDGPRLMVAQSDADDSATLAYAILLALTEVCRNDRKPRPVALTSSHREMQPIFAQFGFQPSQKDRPFVFNGLPRMAEGGWDASRWLVNFDWGDNGLRAPFLDQKEPIS